MKGQYAGHTRVTPERSRGEIERTLARYGAEQFAYATDRQKAAVVFRLNGCVIRLTVPYPVPDNPEVAETPTGRPRKPKAVSALLDQALRQRWRALLLLIKAKLEAAELGVTTVEEEFMGNILLPDGRTVGEFLQPHLEMAREKGAMPALLPWTGRQEVEP